MNRAVFHCVSCESDIIDITDVLVSMLDEVNNHCAYYMKTSGIEKVKLLEQKINKKVKEAYPELKKMLMTVGGDRVERISKAIHYDFLITEKRHIKSFYNRFNSFF